MGPQGRDLERPKISKTLPIFTMSTAFTKPVELVAFVIQRISMTLAISTTKAISKTSVAQLDSTIPKISETLVTFTMSAALEVKRKAATPMTIPTIPVLTTSAVPTISPDFRDKELAMPLRDLASRARSTSATTECKKTKEMCVFVNE